MIPRVITEIAFESNPNEEPVWEDISAYVKSSQINHGRDDELSEFGPGTNSLVLRNNDRRFDPTYAAGPYYTFLLPNRRIQQYVNGPLMGTEFWGDFEAGADGTAPEWTAMNGNLECKAGAETRQLQFKTTPTPRLGARIGRFEVASGDQFGSTSGERCEVRRGGTNGGFGTGDLEGITVYTQFSARFLAPWTLTGEGIFQQTHDSGSTYGAPFFRWRMGSSSNFEFRVVTGNYATSGAATAGSGSSTSYTHTGMAFATDQWFDFRHAIYYTQNKTGWYVAEMKLDSDTEWLTVARMNLVQTLPSIGGAASSVTQFDKCGFYRATPQGSTNVVFQDGYQVGHSWTDVSYDGFTTDPRWNDKGWEGREQAEAQVGNPDFEADITGTAAAGGGTTTRTWDSARAKFGTHALKLETNGAASGQGAFHSKRSLSRYDVVEGRAYTASSWFSGDGGEEVRVGMEFFDSGGSSLTTAYCVPRALRTDFRRLYVQETAPAGAVTMRIRTSLSGTNAATFWVDGVDWWEGAPSHLLFRGNIDSWGQGYPDRLFASDVSVTATDRFKRLTVRAQDVSSPNVEGFDEVVAFDEPSFYYRMGEPEGTKLISHVRRTKHKVSVGGGSNSSYHHVTRRWKTRITRAEIEGVSGPAGTYKNTPTLGAPGAIVGDSDTSVTFDIINDEYARIGPLDASDLIDRNALTLEAWVNANSSLAGFHSIMSGPRYAVGSNAVFEIAVDDSLAVINLIFTSGTATVTGATTLSAGTTYHIVGTWDGAFGLLKVYVNGALDGTDTHIGKILRSGDAGEYLYIARSFDGTMNWDGTVDEVAVYEKALSVERILAHYESGALRGYNLASTGTRIEQVLATTGLSFPTDIDDGVRDILPVRQFGQSSLDPIQQAVEAEGGYSGFFFNAAGVAVFHDREYLDREPYSLGTVAAFSDDPASGDMAYNDHGFDYGEKFLANIVRVQAEGQELVEVEDATSRDTFDDAHLEKSGLLLTDDVDPADEADWLLDRLKTPSWRIPWITFDVDALAWPDQTTQALARECGDGLSISRHPKGGAVFQQDCSIERVSHSINMEAGTWETTYVLAPII